MRHHSIHARCAKSIQVNCGVEAIAGIMPDETCISFHCDSLHIAYLAKLLHHRIDVTFPSNSPLHKHTHIREYTD